MVEGLSDPAGDAAGGGGFEGFPAGEPGGDTAGGGGFEVCAGEGDAAVGEGFEGWNGVPDTTGGMLGVGASVPVCATVMYQGCRSIASTR